MKSKAIKTRMHQYSAVFEEDEEVGGYTVTIPALPGCISEGDTFEEATENIREAAELFLETMHGRKRSFAYKHGRVIVAPVDVAI